MRLSLGLAVLVLLPQASHAEPAAPCEQAAFAAVVGEASTTLAAMNDENKKTFQAKLVSLRAREGWTDADYAAKATPFVKDATTSALDEGNKNLLGDVPQLGAGLELAGPDLASRRCEILEELRTLMGNVVANTRAKWEHMHGKIDAALDVSREAKATAAAR